MMKTIVLDGSKMVNRETAHSYLAEKLGFAEYYGMNLDALHDCLTEISRPTQLVIYHFSDHSMTSNPYLSTLLSVIQASTQENKNLVLAYDVGSLPSYFLS